MGALMPLLIEDVEIGLKCSIGTWSKSHWSQQKPPMLTAAGTILGSISSFIPIFQSPSTGFLPEDAIQLQPALL